MPGFNAHSFRAKPNALAWSPWGDSLAIAGRKQQIDVLDIATANSRLINTSRRAIESLAYAPGGHLLAAGGARGKLMLFDAHYDSLLSETQLANSPIFSIQFTPDGRSIIAACENGEVSRIKLRTPGTGGAP